MFIFIKYSFLSCLTRVWIVIIPSTGKSKEDEVQRVDKEMAKIRRKFTQTRLTGYGQRKYVWKMVYMQMLGYEVDFGAQEVVNLISSTKFSEKSVGYLAVSILLANVKDLGPLLLNAIRSDLMQGDPLSKGLALQTIANMGGIDATAVQDIVFNLLVSPRIANNIRKKAALSLLRVVRSKNGPLPLEWRQKIYPLLDNRNMGVVMATSSLLLAMISRNPADNMAVLPNIILLLHKLVLVGACTSDYKYCQTPAPWLQVGRKNIYINDCPTMKHCSLKGQKKWNAIFDSIYILYSHRRTCFTICPQVRLFRILQYFPTPKDATLCARLNEVLNAVLSKTEVTKSVNKNNTDYSILFEAVNLIIHQGDDSNPNIRKKAVSLLGRFIVVRQPNIRCIGRCMDRPAP